MEKANGKKLAHEANKEISYCNLEPAFAKQTAPPHYRTTVVRHISNDTAPPPLSENHTMPTISPDGTRKSYPIPRHAGNGWTGRLNQVKCYFGHFKNFFSGLGFEKTNKPYIIVKVQVKTFSFANKRCLRQRFVKLSVKQSLIFNWINFFSEKVSCTIQLPCHNTNSRSACCIT